MDRKQTFFCYGRGMGKFTDINVMTRKVIINVYYMNMGVDLFTVESLMEE